MHKPTDHLKFPTGRPVGSARNDAKKLSKSEQIPLVAALDSVARSNGSDLPWNEAIPFMQSQGNNPAAGKIEIGSTFVPPIEALSSLKTDLSKSPCLPNAPLFLKAIATLEKELLQHNNSIFSYQAFALSKCLLPTLIFLNDTKIVDVTDNYIIEQLSHDDCFAHLSEDTIPDNLKTMLLSFLSTIPGFSYSESVCAQQKQFVKTFSLITTFLSKTIQNQAPSHYVKDRMLTFLAIPPGYGNTTILHMCLAEAAKRDGISIFISCSHSGKHGFHELPSELKMQSSIADVSWDRDGKLSYLTPPHQSKKIIFIHALRNPQSLISLAEEFRSWRKLFNIEQILVDDMGLTADFRGVLSNLSSLSKKIILSTQHASTFASEIQFTNYSFSIISKKENSESFFANSSSHENDKNLIYIDDLIDIDMENMFTSNDYIIRDVAALVLQTKTRQLDPTGYYNDKCRELLNSLSQFVRKGE